MIYDNKKLISLFMSMTVLSAVVSCSSAPQQSIDSSVNESTVDENSETQTENAVTESTALTTEEITTETTTAPPKKIKKGNIYDANGNLLMYTERGANGSEKRKVADNYAVPFANIITEMSDGYDRTFNEILSTPSDESKEVGKSIQLTIDSDVQNAVYNYMESANIVGSVVVMRTDGSILSQVSYPSYDPSTVSKTEYDEELAWGEYGNKAFQNFEPGSCFKIMSEVISDKHGIYSVWDEGEWTDDGATIVNWDHDTNAYYPMERSLYSAFTSSSNIFFAKAFDQIGTDEVLNDLDRIFHFVSDIRCDFGDIQNNITITCNDDLRRSAFGQSYILTCPIYLAALGREAVFGDMVRPFVLKNVVDTDNPKKVIERGSQANEVIATIPEEYRQNLLDGMLGVASGLGIYTSGNFTFYAKTGTAETWEGDFLYITGCLKNGNDTAGSSYDYLNYSQNGSYIIVMQLRNPQYHGLDFASESSYLYQGIVNAVLENQN